MGSGIVALRGASQNRAKVIQRPIILAPVAAAIATDSPSPIKLRTGSTGSVTGVRLTRIVPPINCTEPIGLQRPEHSVDHQKGDEGKGCESRGLKAEPRPEHGRIAKRFEPESIDVIGRRRAASKNRNTQGNKQGDTSTSAATPSRANYDITTVFLVAHYQSALG